MLVKFGNGGLINVATRLKVIRIKLPVFHCLFSFDSFFVFIQVHTRLRFREVTTASCVGVSQRDDSFLLHSHTHCSKPAFLIKFYREIKPAVLSE